MISLYFKFMTTSLLLSLVPVILQSGTADFVGIPSELTLLLLKQIALVFCF